MVLPVKDPSGIVGSVVECSPATRAARVRFPDDANLFLMCFHVNDEKKFWRRGVSIPVPLTC